MAFPALLLALVLMTILERSVTNTILVIGIVYATTTARILFGMTLKIKGEVFIDAVICSGAGHLSILFPSHPPKSDFTASGAGQLYLCLCPATAAALDFLGLGIATGNSKLGKHAGRGANLCGTRAPGFCFFQAR